MAFSDPHCKDAAPPADARRDETEGSMTQVTGKICLVTGAADGIGRAISVGMAERGAAAVVVVDLLDGKGEETADLVRRAGADAVFLRVDLRDAAEIAGMIDSTVERFGGLDTLVNNAGVIESALTQTPTLENMPEDVWDTVMAVNVKAVWLATKYAAPHLRRSTRGPSIVNAASTASFVGGSSPAYAASKGAVLQLTRSTAVALGPVVRCNCYCPSAVRTPMMEGHLASSTDRDATIRAMWGAHLLERPGEPEEVANLVCFLASDEASFLTGQAYLADGGSLAWRGTH
jgi:NAD(P)-dependent dehydrogenase (short-subunit alcohol dehydrogenase family)